MIQTLRKEACLEAIADLSHVRNEHCLSDCLAKRSANPRNLLNSVQAGWLKEVDSHPPFRSMTEHKAFLNAWLRKKFAVLGSVQHVMFTQEHLKVMCCFMCELSVQFGACTLLLEESKSAWSLYIICARIAEIGWFKLE